jgi:hypothetical protein
LTVNVRILRPSDPNHAFGNPDLFQDLVHDSIDGESAGIENQARLGINLFPLVQEHLYFTYSVFALQQRPCPTAPRPAHQRLRRRRQANKQALLLKQPEIFLVYDRPSACGDDLTISAKHLA